MPSRPRGPAAAGPSSTARTASGSGHARVATTRCSFPTAKLAGPGGPAAPVAILSQSGGFAISRLSRLRGIEPRYVITVGNQMDLTIGDHLENLAGDSDVGVVAVYVEGFTPLDGLRFLRAAARLPTAAGPCSSIAPAAPGPGARRLGQPHRLDRR